MRRHIVGLLTAFIIAAAVACSCLRRLPKRAAEIPTATASIHRVPAFRRPQPLPLRYALLVLRARGYYPYYGSDLWVPRKYMKTRYRYKYLGPRYRYYPAWATKPRRSDFLKGVQA